VLEIEAGDVSEQDAHVPVALEHVAEGDGDLPRRESTGRKLVDEWLEEVEVAAIDEGDLDRRTTERAGRVQTAETAADDDDPMPHYVSTEWAGNG
jgi:hypothetical protein